MIHPTSEKSLTEFNQGVMDLQTFIRERFAPEYFRMKLNSSQQDGSASALAKTSVSRLKESFMLSQMPLTQNEQSQLQ